MAQFTVSKAAITGFCLVTAGLAGSISQAEARPVSTEQIIHQLKYKKSTSGPKALHRAQPKVKFKAQPHKRTLVQPNQHFRRKGGTPKTLQRIVVEPKNPIGGKSGGKYVTKRIVVEPKGPQPWQGGNKWPGKQPGFGTPPKRLQKIVVEPKGGGKVAKRIVVEPKGGGKVAKQIIVQPKGAPAPGHTPNWGKGQNGYAGYRQPGFKGYGGYATAARPASAVTYVPGADRPSIDLEVFFAYDSSILLPSAIPVLLNLGNALSDGELRGGNFLIAGHTDARGGNYYNIELSNRRAEAVRQFLLSNFNLQNTSLVAVGYGEEVLKNAANPYSGINRRVQIVNLTR